MAIAQLELKPPTALPRDRILQPGRNCWRVETAERASVLVDAANYFGALENALRKARRSIFIQGWDFDASISLGGRTGDREPERLGDLLRSMVEAHPQLEIRILIWNLSTLHAPSATAPMLIGDGWSSHPRIQVKLDHDHPVYAAPHQKIVVIDDSLAFVGGMDLTVSRWDTPEHKAIDPRRTNADGSTYEPVHDVHAAVDGEAAQAVAQLARHRWMVAVGEVPPPLHGRRALWPDDLVADFRSAPIAIARTSPRWNGQPAAREIAFLNLDALQSARRHVYIEAQYLTDFRIADCLSQLLEKDDGPEIVIIVTRFKESFLEGRYMGENRNRLIRKLMRADRYGRLRTYCLAVPCEGGRCGVFVHSKVMMVDDRLLRVGSSNLANRSMGLDIECDLAIEAEDEQTSDAIASIRRRLLAEHLETSEALLAEEESRRGSLVAAIEALAAGSRLKPVLPDLNGPVRPVFGTAIVDPRRPIPFLSLGRRLLRRLTSLRRLKATLPPIGSGVPVR